MSYTRYKVRLWNWDGESFSTEVEIFENYEEAERKFASTDVTTALPYIQLVKERIASGCVIEDTTIKEKNDPKPTNFEAITKNAQELGRFLRSLPILEAPWDTEFQKRYCSGCSFAGDRRDPAYRLYAVERDRRAGRNTAFGGGAYAASIPFPDPDACAGTGRNGVHTGRGGG